MGVFTFSPPWFCGVNIFIDVFSLITLLLIAFFSYQVYRLDKDKKMNYYLSLAFLLMAAGLFAKVFTTGLIFYHQPMGIANIPVVNQIVNQDIQGVRASTVLFTFSVMLFRLCTLIGLYILYSVFQKRFHLSDAIVVLTAFFLVTFYSQSGSFGFHIMAIPMIGLIAYRFYDNYRRNHMGTTLLLTASFMTILLSHSLFIFEGVSPMCYVTAEYIQLIGYFLLLLTFIMVLQHGKKTKSYRHNIRHAKRDKR